MRISSVFLPPFVTAAMLKGKKEIYGFGPFRLDVSEHRLERDDGGEIAYLPEKAFQTLVVLVRNAGSLVTKEELLNEVWPDTIVEENNLDKCIYTIRHSLGDSPSQHQYIQTVRKHGYRFSADVRSNDGMDNGAAVADVPEETNQKYDAGILGVSTANSITAREVRFRNAFEICQQARFKYEQMTAPTTVEARELVDEALRLEPDHPFAHSFSAELTTLEVIVGLKSPEQGLAQARASIVRARELGGDSTDFLASAAYVDLIADWDFASAEKKLRRALVANEHHSPANRMLTEVLMFQGRHDEAADYIKRAQVETRLHNANVLAISRFLARDYPAVIDTCEFMLTLAPENIIPVWEKCWALEQMGRADEAIAAYEKILNLPHGEPALRWIGYAYAAVGDRQKALETVARLEAASREHSLSPTHLAAVHARLGEIDKAVSYMKKGLEVHDPFMLWVPTDPRFDELRRDDRFIEIMDRVLEKAKARKTSEPSRKPKEIRIVPSVQDTADGFQNEPTISTATTESGAFVISAKWRPPGSLTPQPTTTKRPSSAVKVVVIVVLLAIIAVGAVLVFYYYFAARVNVFGPKSIAILPFKPIDSSNRDELYEIGIADSLIQRMGGLANLVVRPLGATRKYADLQQDPATAGREQQVNYVLTANYQLSDGKIRVTAQLINVATGQVEETLKTESGASDVFGMQDEIADQIGKALLVRFASVSGTQSARRGTANEEAYRLYIHGMYFYSKRTLAASTTAVELLDRAVQLDPKYALAWAGKAHAHRYAGNLGRDTDTHGEYRRSIEAINTALSLNKDLSEAHSALCENKYYYEFDFAGAGGRMQTSYRS